MATREPADTRDLVTLLRTGEAPREIRQFAARGLLPLDADDQIRALLAVVDDPEPDTLEAARASLGEIKPDELSRFLRQGGPTGIELDTIARRNEDPFVLEQIIRNKNVADETLMTLARTVSGAPQEALIVNQVRLLKTPAIIEALFENPNLTIDGKRRLLEVREEFFEKDERRREAERLRLEEEARAAAEPKPGELTAEEQAEVDAARKEEGGASSLSDTEFRELLTGGGIFRRISTMTVSEKIKLAYAGGKEERRVLVGDANKLVGMAVMKSRGLTLNEVESFCQMRHLDDEIYRIIGNRRDWVRKLPIVLALVKNPKVPLAITLPLVKHVPLRDLRSIQRDLNLHEGLRVMARKNLEEKRR